MKGEELGEADLRDSIRFFLNKCCKEYPEAIITEDGEWQLKCGKCGKICGTLKEKYNIEPRLFIY